MPKISELPLANKLKEEDYIPIVQDGVTKKVKGTHFVTEEEYSLDAFSPTIVANDKAMYKFGEGDSVDFSDSTYDGAYKSAILKGRTLVNLIPKGSQSQFDVNNTYGGGMGFWEQTEHHYTIKPSTKYLVIVNVTFNSGSKMVVNNNEGSIACFKDALYVEKNEVGCFKWIVTSRDDLSNCTTILRSYTTEVGQVIGTMQVLEYQEGMENWDIPYFTGMSSVKMPVLTTTGKNLASPTLLELDSSGGNVTSTVISTNAKNQLASLMKIEPNKQIVISKKNKGKRFRCFFFDQEPIPNVTQSIGGMYSDTTNVLTVTSPSNAKYLFVVWCNDKTTEHPEDFQVEYGTVATSHQPHKSNILSTPSDLELRGIGDVRDELDLITGELTQRVGESNLENFTNCFYSMDVFNGYCAAIIDLNNKASSSVIKANLVPTQDFTDGLDCGIYNNPINVVVFKKGTSLEEFENFVSNLIIQYQLETPTVKTVDLSGVPFGYKGGHITKSSAEGSLLPKFEYEVAVSRGAQISQNTSTLIKHDEKISELLKKTAAVYINQKVKIANLLDEIGTQDKVQTIPLVDMTDSDMVLDNMGVEHEIEIVENPDSLLINLIYDLIELNDTFELLEKVEILRRSGLIDKQNYEVIKVKLNGAFEGE